MADLDEVARAGRRRRCAPRRRDRNGPRAARRPRPARRPDGRRRGRPPACRRCRRATSGLASEPVVTDAGRVGPRPSRVHLHAGVPAERGDKRHPAVGRRIAEREVRQPAAAAHPQQLVGVGRDGVRAKRGQVLIRERIADQQVVVGVRPAREGAEGRRDAPALDVERALRPRAQPDVQRVRPRTARRFRSGPRPARRATGWRAPPRSRRRRSMRSVECS